MALHVQDYLRAGKTLDSLQATLGIVSKRHPAHPNLILFKYDQIDSPMGNPIVQECRGIILDEENHWNVVARGFDKFFNFGEGNAATIDMSSAQVRVQEKVDGSLCLVYFYKDEWHIATTGTPDAGGEVNGSGISFADLFWKTLDGRFTEFAKEKQKGLGSGFSPRDFCFMFELTGPLNRVVVAHQKSDLTLLGARYMRTWEEVHPGKIALYFPGVPIVKEYPFQTVEDIFATLDSMNPLEQEGYVRVWKKPDGTFGRDKIKCPPYVAMHHAKDGLSASVRNFVEIVRKGESSEWISAFPELEKRMNEIRVDYLSLIVELQEWYIKHAPIPVQKDFALAIKDCRCSGALFAVRAGKCKSIREYLSTVHIDSLMRLLNLK